MSSQLKKRYDELVTYLDKDARGKEKLKLYKDAVNVLRKNLAASEDRTSQAEELKTAARERADAAEAAATSLRLEVHTLRQQVANLNRELEIATRATEQVDDIEEQDDDLLDVDEQELRGVLKTLRKSVPVCPTAVEITSDIGALTCVFNRDDFVRGWSHKSLWILGASVAVLAAAMGQVVIKTPKYLPQSKNPNDEGLSGVHRHLYEWLILYKAVAQQEAKLGGGKVKPHHLSNVLEP